MTMGVDTGLSPPSAAMIDGASGRVIVGRGRGVRKSSAHGRSRFGRERFVDEIHRCAAYRLSRRGRRSAPRRPAHRVIQRLMLYLCVQRTETGASVRTFQTMEFPADIGSDCSSATRSASGTSVVASSDFGLRHSSRAVAA